MSLVRGTGRWTRGASATLVVGCLLLACAGSATARVPPPGPAGVQLWQQPERITSPQMLGGTTQLAYDAQGTAYLAWSGSGYRHGVVGEAFYEEGSLQPVRFAYRPAGAARFRGFERLSAQPGAEVELAISADGEALAIWAFDGGIQYAIRPPDGKFSKPVSFKRTEDSAYNLDADMADDGSALVTWNDAAGPSVALYRVGKQRFRPVPGFRDANSPDVLSDVNRRGDMAVIWETWSDRKQAYVVHQSSLRAGGSFGESRDYVADDGEFTFGGSLLLSERGEALVGSGREYKICPLRGRCSPFERFHDGQGTPNRLVADSEGNIHAFWIRFVGRRRGAWRMLDSIRAPGGSFSKPRIVARRAKVSYLGPVAAGPQGSLLLGWTTCCHISGLYAKVYRPETGWGPPLRASHLYNEKGPIFPSIAAPALGLDPFGNATALWGVSCRFPSSCGLLSSELPNFGQGPISDAPAG